MSGDDKRYPRPRTLTTDERAQIEFRVTTTRRLDDVEGRLNSGAQSFQDIKDTMKEVERAMAQELLGLRREVAAEITQVRPETMLRRMWWILGVALVGIGSSWGTLQATKTDRDEVVTIVQETSPYQFDRQRISRVVDRYDQDQASIVKTLGEIKSEVVKLNAKLERSAQSTPTPRRRRR